ncbi:MAG: glycosyltransferase [Gemmatimonadota bacterium]
MSRVPVRILHVDLANGLPDLPWDPTAAATWVILWWRTLPLARLEFASQQPPLDGDLWRIGVSRAIAPAVAGWLMPELFRSGESLLGIREMPPRVGLGRPIPTSLEVLSSALIPDSGGSSTAVSLVICTRDRPDDLARCLDSVHQLVPRPLETIVVDNAPATSATRELVAGMVNVRYIPEPRPGLSRARNAGVCAARGDIVAFTDDDVRVTPNWIAAVEHGFREPTVSVVTGLVLPAELETESQLIFEQGFGGFGQGFHRQLYGNGFFWHTRAYGVPVWRIGAGASMAIRRSAFERVGLFDERLGAGAAGCSEDSELWYRVLAEGGQCCYDPRVVVHHYHRREIRGLQRQMYLYLRGHAAALLIQFSQYHHWGNLRRLVYDIPSHHAKLVIKGILRRTKHRKYLLGSEIRGTVAGVFYFFQRRKDPAYSPTGQSAPMAKVASFEVDEPAADVPIGRGYQELWLLARQRGIPLGWIQMPIPPGSPVIPATAVRARLPRQWTSDPEPVGNHGGATPPISVVVCTRDRPELLRRFLESARCLRYPNWELIVVDNAPADNAAAEVAAQFEVRYVKEARPGLDWARNRGIHEAVHGIVAFTDDDVQVDTGWLTALGLGFADPSVMAVTGLVAPLELDTLPQMLFERVCGGMGKGMQSRLYQRDRLRPTDLIQTQAIGVGANMAFRRTVFERIGDFDTALDVGTPAGGGGDLDIFHRVLAAGFVLRYEPRALVWHRHRREMSELRQLFYNDGRSFAVYLGKLWRTRTVSRLALAGYTVWRWGRWLVGRIVLGLLGRHRLPLPLLLAGLWGALSGPGAYRATYRNDERIRGAGRGQFTSPAVE